MAFAVSLDDLIRDLLEITPLDRIERLAQLPAPATRLKPEDVGRLLGPSARTAVVSAQEREQQLIDAFRDDVEAGRPDDGRLRDFLAQRRRAQLVQRGKWDDKLLARIERGATKAVARIEAEVEKRWRSKRQEVFELAGFAPDVAAKRVDDLDKQRREWRASGGPPYEAFDPPPLDVFVAPPPALVALRHIINFLGYRWWSGKLPLRGRPHVGWPDFTTGEPRVIEPGSGYQIDADAEDDHLRAQLRYTGESRGTAEPERYVDLETTIEAADAARASWAALFDKSNATKASIGVASEAPQRNSNGPVVMQEEAQPQPLRSTSHDISKPKRSRAGIDDRRALLEMARLLAGPKPISAHAAAMGCAHLTGGQSTKATVHRLCKKINALEPIGDWQEIVRSLESELGSNKTPI